MNRPINRLMGSCLFVAVTACSSGGGDGGSPIPMQTGPVVITMESAPDVSTAVVKATIGIQDIGDIVGAGTIGTSASQQKSGGVAAHAQSKTDINETLPCSGGGSITLVAQLEDPATVSVGDSISSSSDSCNEFDFVLDGGFDFVIDRVEGSANDILFGRFALGASVVVNNLSITASSVTTTANGDFRFELDTTASDIAVLELSGNVFSIDDAGDILTMSNFTIERTDETGGGVYTLKTSGTVDSAELQGSVTYVTVQTFIGFGDDFPYSGEMRITGAGGSTINLIAISGADVRLEIDSDGDGAVDDVIDTTWADITA